MPEDNKNENRAQEPNPPTEYFARIPYAVFDARENGELTPSMFLAMVWLFKWADWSSGSVEKMCAERLVWATEGEFEKRTFEEALQNLQKARWIHSHHKQGSKRPYRVDICNYVALSGALKNQILNPSVIKAWRNSEKSGRADTRADSALTDRGDDREVHREVTGSPAATTMRVSSENNTRGSSGDFQESDSPGYKEAKTATVEKTASTPELIAKLIQLERAKLESSLRDELYFSAHEKRAPDFEGCFQVHRDKFNSLGRTLPQIIQIQNDALAAVLEPKPSPKPKPAPTPARTTALPDKPVNEALLAALKASPSGHNTKELVSICYGIPESDPGHGRAWMRIANTIQRLRKKGYPIVTTGTCHLDKRYVLRHN
jgi:hypothetical protein